MEIKAENYRVEYNQHHNTVVFGGSLLLNGSEEYAPIAQLLSQMLEQQPDVMTLDIQSLKMLNSSGFQMLSKFMIKARQYQAIHVLIKGNSTVTWQAKSLKNLQRLMPSVEIELE
jgi:hypothetical protein